MTAQRIIIRRVWESPRESGRQTIGITLDDFGTGYASLNYLRSFPFDKIKIDKCFFDDIEASADCRAIVRAVIGLATSLGMVTTAEGVEHPDQLELLRAEGCTEVQGYLYSRPSRADQFTDLRQRSALTQNARAIGAGILAAPLPPALDAGHKRSTPTRKCA